MMLILGLLGMYFDAAVVFVKKSSLLFRLAVAILWCRCDYVLICDKTDHLVANKLIYIHG